MNKKENELHKVTHNKKRLLEALQKSLGVVTTACNIAGVSRKTHYNYCDADEEYKQAVQDIEDVVLDFVESKLHQSIEQGNITAIIFTLKTKGKQRGYIERTETYFKNEGNNLPKWLLDEE